MTEDATFLRAIQDAPEDDGVRLVYADWLEERGDPRGEYLRLDTAAARMPWPGTEYQPQRPRLSELRVSLEREWVTTVSRSPHDVVKRLHVVTYPPSLGGRWTTQDVAAPSWAHIETAIRRLDRHEYPFIWLLLEDEIDGKRFDILGGKGAYTMWGCLADQQMGYHNPVGGDSYVDVWTSDQGYSAPEKEVCHDLETVVRVAKYVYYYRAFAPGISWA